MLFTGRAKLCPFRKPNRICFVYSCGGALDIRDCRAYGIYNSDMHSSRVVRNARRSPEHTDQSFLPGDWSVIHRQGQSLSSFPGTKHLFLQNQGRP